MVWRSLAILVEYGPVEMAISTAVGTFADIQDISFAPVRMALCADSYLAVSSCTVALRMADFCGPEMFVCFPGLTVVAPQLSFRRMDGRP
jgi:hypothetical protein